MKKENKIPAVTYRSLFLIVLLTILAGFSPARAVFASPADIVGSGPTITRQARLFAGGRGILHIYAPAQYLDPMVLEDFSAATGYRPIVETYKSNLEMRSILNSGPAKLFDVVIFRNQMLGYLANNRYLAPLPEDGLNHLDDVSPYFNSLGHYRERRFAVPLTWRIMGILYNKEAHDSEIHIFGWESFFNPSIHQHAVVLPETPRFSMGLALQELGYHFDSAEHEELMEAAGMIRQVTDSPLFLGFASLEKAASMCAQDLLTIAVVSNQDASRAIRVNRKLDFITADDGIPTTADMAALGAGSAEPEAALAFIDYLMEPRVAARNADYARVSTVNVPALGYIRQSDREDKALYPALEALPALDFAQAPDSIDGMYDVYYWREATGEHDVEVY